MPENNEKVIDQEGDVVEEKATAIAEFSKTEAALTAMKHQLAERMPDFVTKEGYEEGRVAIRELVTLRTSLDKARKELNADDQARIKFRNNEAKRITGELVGMEEPLKAAKAVIDDAVELAKEEERRKEELRIENITAAINAITVCGNVDPTMESDAIKIMLTTVSEVNTEYDFEEFQEAAEAERKRVVMHVEKVLFDRLEFEQQQAEQKKIAQEQAEKQRLLDEKGDELKRQQAAQQKKIDDQQAEIDRQKEEAKAEAARKEKAEQDRIAEAERVEAARLKAIADEEENKRLAAEADRLAEVAAAEKEARRSDEEKVKDWAAKLRFIDGPDGVTDEKCMAIVSAGLISLNVVATHIITKVEAL